MRMAMWEAQKKAIDKQFKDPGAAGSEAHQKELERLGPEPEKPLAPLIMSSEFTFEGMVRCLNLGQPQYGIIGSEGGQFIGGHGMTEEVQIAHHHRLECRVGWRADQAGARDRNHSSLRSARWHAPHGAARSRRQ